MKELESLEEPVASATLSFDWGEVVFVAFLIVL